MRIAFRTLLLAGAAVLGVSGALAQTTIGTSPATISQLVQIVWNGQNISSANPLPVAMSGGAPVGPSSTASSAIQPTVTRGASVMTAKASAGNLYGFSLTQGTTAGFFAFVDAAAAPAAGAAIAPVECVAVPASGYVARRQDIADRYASGIQIVSTTSCTTYTANTPVQMSASVQ